jgi:multimeric flavodoxin WrbA
LTLHTQRIKLLGINGSPRPRGNSQFLLDQAVEEAATVGEGFIDVEVYRIGGKDIAPCNSCRVCTTRGDCSIQDDFQQLRDKWADADAIIYSIPVYHMTIPGNLRCFIDRLGSSLWGWYGGGLSKSLKVIGSITQGAHIFSGQEHAITDLVNHALVMGCVPVSGDLWESYIGASGWTRCSATKDALRKLFEEGDPDAEVAVRAARSLARRVLHRALLIKTGGDHHREMLEQDGGYRQFLGRLS